MIEQTDIEYARQQIEAEREAYWIGQMQLAYETGRLCGKAEALCDEIEHEMKERGYTPREEAIAALCPF